MATIIEYQQEIERLDGLIDKGIKEAQRLRAAANDWKADGAGMKIRSGKKGVSDRADRERKFGIYEDLIRQARALESEVKSWQELRTENMRLKDGVATSSREVAQALAKQGLTHESLEIQAKAEAEAVVKNAEADSSNKKKVGLIIAGIGVVIIIGVSVVLYKKLKTKK